MDELIAILSRLEVRRADWKRDIDRAQAALDEVDYLITIIQLHLHNKGCKKIGEHWVGGNEE